MQFTYCLCLLHVQVNSETGRITLSLKQSRCLSTDASFIQEYFLLEEKVEIVVVFTIISGFFLFITCLNLLFNLL